MSFSSGETFRVGTRGSRLALTQTRAVAGSLSEVSGMDHELITIKSEGDVLTGPLSQMGGTGVFAAALRSSLLAHRCDIAVHSLKDLPAENAPGLDIAAVPIRAEVRDALCSADDMSLEDLPARAKVGTGSPRRRAQLLAARPDLEVVDIRGNVGTRLARVRGREDSAETSSQAPDPLRGDLDAVVLAAAGLNRLGFEHHISELLDTSVMLPAPGQGALAVEVREADAEEFNALSIGLAQLHALEAGLETIAERAMLAGLNAGCSAPIGGLGRYEDRADGSGSLRLDVVVLSLDGSATQRAGAEIQLDLGTTRDDAEIQAAALGERIAAQLINEDTGLLAHVIGT